MGTGSIPHASPKRSWPGTGPWRKPSPAAGRGGERLVVALLGMGHVEHAHGVAHQLAALGVTGTVGFLPWDADRPCEDLVPGVADAVFGVEPPLPRDGEEAD